MKDTSTISGNPLLDAESFQKLLAAAYVLQEHNDQLTTDADAVKDSPKIGSVLQRDAPPESEEILFQVASSSDYSQVLAQIVATQQQIQRSHLALQEAMNLIAEQTRRITRASGAAIGLREADQLVYRAASGSANSLAGTRVQADSSVSATCLNDGAVFYCPEVDTDSRLDEDVCRQRGIKALIAVPISYEGKVAGSVEVHFAAANAFEEHDIRTCQLMAGLITEAMARAAELEWKQALAQERATMLEALEKLKPQLQRLASEPETVSAKPNMVPVRQGVAPAPRRSLAIPCTDCGNQLDADQLFCGQCGAERTAPTEIDIQNKWSSTWPSSRTQTSQEEKVSAAERDEAPISSPTMWDGYEAGHELKHGSADVFGASTTIFDATQHPAEVPGELVVQSSALEAGTHPAPSPASSGLSETKSYPWTSTAKAKAWLESQLGNPRRGTLKPLLKVRRADIYLAIAIILVIASIGWMIRSNSSTPGPGTATTAASDKVGSSRRKKPPEPKLTMMEKMLVELGLAEPPPAPLYTGNPATQVWVDLQTALYYCPGTDLYGKTSKGKFTTQRDAQMDQFEPAYRRACD